ncbi:MAG: 1-deoxy-D-xylulose-5-phosphate reductoisomerase [Christensenellales bacterium]|jgi:1-deoxy-D-xylulose-5-phosphate reductoisomerase
MMGAAEAKLKKIAIIGSTGSVGSQALDVISRNPGRFEVTALAAYSSAELLCRQVETFSPSVAVLVKPPEGFVPPKGKTRWYFGEKARDEICCMGQIDDVLVSVVGMAGLTAVMECIKNGKRVLLANKETLMAGGDFVMAAAKEKCVEIMPVDSEHTAIHQCLLGRKPEEIDKLVLTASGGPFRTWEKEAMLLATAKDALAHPNWSMGKKITVDSATMMNKSIEIVEAHHLFDMPGEKIQVAVHPQSIIHSAVLFKDRSMTANLSFPDMRIPILYALGESGALNSGAREFSLFDMPSLSFERCDAKKFPLIQMAYDSIAAGGNACVVSNAANEVAVDAFLKGEIRIGGIIDCIFSCVDRLFSPAKLNYDEIFQQDADARACARDYINSIK